MQEVFEQIIDRFADQQNKNRYESHNDEWNAGLYQAEQIVNAFAAEYNNGWIPCSERLPEKNGTYIATQATHSLVNHNKILRIDTEHVDFSNGIWKRAKHLEIIAWQPLPEPYKEGE